MWADLPFALAACRDKLVVGAAKARNLEAQQVVTFSSTTYQDQDPEVIDAEADRTGRVQAASATYSYHYLVKDGGDGAPGWNWSNPALMRALQHQARMHRSGYRMWNRVYGGVSRDKLPGACRRARH